MVEGTNEMVGAAGLEPATLCLEGSVSTRNLLINGWHWWSRAYATKRAKRFVSEDTVRGKDLMMTNFDVSFDWAETAAENPTPEVRNDG